jgi:Peptidase family S41
MRSFALCVSMLALAPCGFAQLTIAQKTSDFNQIVGLYAKNYAPYELRRDLFGFDLYNTAPWLTQIVASTDDLTFYDICTRYIASLQDSHDEFITPSDFEAILGFDADIFDGKVLIGDIDPLILPPNLYPFQVGDQIVSVDGVDAMVLVTSLIPYAVNGEGSKTSQMRLAAGGIADRYQGWNPKATHVPASSQVVILRQNGQTQTFTIPWLKFGTAFVQEGPVPMPPTSSLAHRARSIVSAGNVPLTRPGRITLRTAGNPWGTWQGSHSTLAPDPIPDYMQAIKKVSYGRAMAPIRTLTAGIDPYANNFDPVFAPPAGFKLRLGAKATDEFLSGTFPVGKSTVGFIRVSTMEPDSETTALTQFNAEMAFFQKNTDGLVIDIMANGGGDGCYPQQLGSAIVPYTFRGLAADLRATQDWVLVFSDDLLLAQEEGAPQWVLNLYQLYLKDTQQALSENRGDTGSLPLCSETFDVTPLTSSTGANIAYSKPILLLTDNFTLSAAEIFAMELQDAKRATLFGTRTDGGGGNVVEYDAFTDYSEGTVRVTQSLITRAQPVATPGFPAGPYSIFYDGQGIYPDIVEDYQTLDNLLHNGETFVTDFSTAIANLIAGGN